MRLRWVPLQELNLWQRIALAISIVVIALIVLIFVSWLGKADAQPRTETDIYGDLPFDPALLHFDKQALDEAYQEQVRHLFAIWVKGQATSSKEITAGLGVARRAYTSAAAQIAKREQRIGAPK